MNWIVLLLVTAASISIQADKDLSLGSTRTALFRLDDDWNTALLKHDTSYFSSTLPRSFLFIEAKGRWFGKSNFLGGVSETFYSMAESSDREVTIYDGFAILVGARTERFKQPFPESEERFRRVRYVKVFRKKDNSWEPVSYQESPIGPF